MDLYIEQSVHHMQRGHLAVFNDRRGSHRACHYGKIPFHRIAIHFHPRLVHGMCTPATNLLGCFQNHRPGKDNVILLSEEQTETLLCMNEKLRQASQSEKYGSDVLMTACLAELLVYVNSLYRDFKQEQPAAADKTIGAVMDYIDANLSPELSLPKHCSLFFHRQILSEPSVPAADGQHLISVHSDQKDCGGKAVPSGRKNGDGDLLSVRL